LRDVDADVEDVGLLGFLIVGHEDSQPFLFRRILAFIEAEGAVVV
jgi:hypothetical protein